MVSQESVVGTPYKIKIVGVYTNFETYDPFAAHYDPSGLGIEHSTIEITVPPACPGGLAGVTVD